MLYPHVVNNCIKRHISIPTYSASTENVYMDEYAQGMPYYQQSYMYNQNTCNQNMFNQGMMNQQMKYSPNQYQGNIGTEGLQQAQYQNPYTNMVNPMNPFNY